MRGRTRIKIAPVIICQNNREEVHLTLRQGLSGKFVDLRTCSRSRETGKVSFSGQIIAVDLQLWPQFIAAVSNPETWTEPSPFWGQQKSRDSGKGRLIFPQEVLQNNPQEQIFLEHKNFQRIPFILLKTMARTTRGRVLSLVTIGPLLWSQFMPALMKLEEALLALGWLAQEHAERIPLTCL